MSQLETFSRLVFGSKHRLRVIGAIARTEPGVIFAKQIAQESGVSPNVVGGELKRLVEAGLLTQVNEFIGGGQQVLYERQTNPIWELATRVESVILSSARNRAR